MKRKAQKMLAVATRLANRIETETGLAASAGLDDHLLDSFVVVSLDPRFRKPGRLFEYLQDTEAANLLRTRGLMEVHIEILPDTSAAVMKLSLVRREPTSRKGEEAFVTHELPRPPAEETARLVERLRTAAEREGFVVSQSPDR